MLSRKTIAAGLVGIALSVAATAVVAGDITLKSIDGTISMTGDLVEFDGVNYRLRTAIGEVVILAEGVECTGEACPEIAPEIPEVAQTPVVPETPAVPQTTSFIIAGSNAMGETLIPALLEAFALERGGDIQVAIGAYGQSTYVVKNDDGSTYASVTVISGTSDRAFAALSDGTAAIGMSSRAASENEIISFVSSGGGVLTDADQERIVALDGVVALVNQNNPVKAMTLGDMAAVFAGEIVNWSDLGGRDAPITLIMREGDAGTSAVFQNKVLAPSRNSLSEGVSTFSTNAAVADAVSQNVNAIGIGSMAEERNARALAVRGVCGQIAAPNRFAIKTEEYPLTRRMFLYLGAGPRLLVVDELVAFIGSDLAQSVVNNSGFVGQSVTSLTLNEQGLRLANAVLEAGGGSGALVRLQEMTAQLFEARRLSLTFRFVSGTSSLDNRALDDVERMAEMVRGGEFDGHEILVTGFTDNIGLSSENQRLSLVRAEQVAEAIRTAVGPEIAARVTLTPIGYGKLSPLGCNETPAGREINRRVELWILNP